MTTTVCHGRGLPVRTDTRDAPTASDPQPDAAVEDAAVSEAPTGSVAPTLTNAAGREAPPAVNAVDAGAAAAEPDAPAAGSGAAMLDPSVTTLSFQVTTSAIGGRYQPKNIGDWIEDDNGDVVKTLQVWAGTRRRYLTGYLGAMAGSSIDIATSATASWHLTDRSGAAVAPAMYHVRMELTDSNQTGSSNNLDFNTSQGPTTLSPSDAPSFGAMKLELQ